MPSLTTASRVRAFEEGARGSVLYTPTALLATGAAGVDGCLVEFKGGVQTPSASYCPDEERSASVLVRLPNADCLAVAITAPDTGATDIKTFNCADLTLKGMLYRTTQAVRGMACNEDGSKLAIALGDGSVVLLSTVDITDVKILSAAHKGACMAVAWKGHSTLASAGVDGVVRLWDASTVSATSGTGQRTLPGATSLLALSLRCQGLAFSPDGRHLAVAGRPDVLLLDAATLDTLATLTRSPQPSSCVAWSANGLYLAASDLDEEAGSSRVHIWNVPQRSVAEVWECENLITGLALSASKNEVAVADADGWVATAPAVSEALHASPVTPVDLPALEAEAAIKRGDDIVPEASAVASPVASAAQQAAPSSAAPAGSASPAAASGSGSQLDLDSESSDGEDAPRVLRRKHMVLDEAEEGGDEDEGGQHLPPARPRTNLLDELEARYAEGGDGSEGLVGSGPHASLAPAAASSATDRVDQALRLVGATLNGQDTDCTGAQMPFNPACIPARPKAGRGSGLTQAALHYTPTTRLLARRTSEYTLLVVEAEDRTSNITAPRTTTMGRLGPAGVLLGTQAVPEEGAPATELPLVPGTVEYHPLGSWAESSTDVWSATLRGGDTASARPAGASRGRRGEQPLCLAVGREWVAVATTWNALYVWRTSGVLDGIVQLPGRPVALTGRGPLLGVVYQSASAAVSSLGAGSTPTQSFQWALFQCGDVRNTSLAAWDAAALCSAGGGATGGALGALSGATLAPAEASSLGFGTTPRVLVSGPLPLQPGALLRWLGISSEGLLVVQDSYGLLSGASPAHAWSWVPLLDTARDVSLAAATAAAEAGRKGRTPRVWHYVLGVGRAAMLSLPVYGGSHMPEVDGKRKLLNHTPLRCPMPLMSDGVAIPGAVSDGPVPSAILRSNSSVATGNSLADAGRSAVLMGASRWLAGLGLRLGTGPGGAVEVDGDDVHASDIVEDSVGFTERDRVLADGFKAEIAADKQLLKVLTAALQAGNKLAAVHIASTLRTLKASHAAAQLAHKNQHSDVAQRLFDLYKARREERKTIKEFGTPAVGDAGATAEAIQQLQDAVLELGSNQESVGLDEAAVKTLVESLLPTLLPPGTPTRGSKRQRGPPASPPVHSPAVSPGKRPRRLHQDGPSAGQPDQPAAEAPDAGSVASAGEEEPATPPSSPPVAEGKEEEDFNPFKRVSFTSPGKRRSADAFKSLVAGSPARRPTGASSLSPAALRRSSSFAQEARRKHRQAVDA